MATRDIPKKSFVITYGKAHGYVDFSTFSKECHLKIDECHTTSCNAVVYAYLHFKERVRISIVEEAMERLKKSHGVISSAVFGYDEVSSTSKGNHIEEHIAFQMLVGHMNTKNPAFIPCTDGQPEVSRGVLKRYKDCTQQVIDFLGNKHSGKSHLANHVCKMQAQIEELKSELETKEVEIEEMGIENKNLKRKCEIYRIIISGYENLAKYRKTSNDNPPQSEITTTHVHN